MSPIANARDESGTRERERERVAMRKREKLKQRRGRKVRGRKDENEKKPSRIDSRGRRNGLRRRKRLVMSLRPIAV